MSQSAGTCSPDCIVSIITPDRDIHNTEVSFNNYFMSIHWIQDDNASCMFCMPMCISCYHDHVIAKLTDSDHFSQLKRQRAQQAVKKVKLPQSVDQAHFAKETVSSILKKAPAGDGPGAQSKTPPRTPTKEGPRTPERLHYHDMDNYLSPELQRRKYEQQVYFEADNRQCYFLFVCCAYETRDTREIAHDRSLSW